MERTEIQDRNKDIALMLGFKYKNQNKYWGRYPLDNNSFLSRLGYVMMNNLKFHSDWNWLMEAVEFISKNGFTYSIYKNDKLYCCSIRIDRTISDFILIKNESQKEAVFKAVSDFAKLYNEKKP
jgi:hypothetical protein